MSYTIKQQVFEGANTSILKTAIYEWLGQQFEELVPVGTSSFSYRGEHGGFRLYTGSSPSVGSPTKYYVGISSVYALTESSYTNAYNSDIIPTSVVVGNSSILKMGITVIRSDDAMVIIPGNYTFTANASEPPCVKYVTSQLQGKFLGVGKIGAEYPILYLLPSGENSHYGSKSNTVIPDTLPADAPSGSLIASLCYVWTTSVWMEPTPVTDFYKLYGRTYPDLLTPVTIDGLQLIRITTHVAIGQ